MDLLVQLLVAVSLPLWCTNNLEQDFPYQEFFDLKQTRYANIKKYLCSTINQTSTSCCSCERQCAFFGTCCIDWYWYTFNKTKQYNADDYVKNYLRYLTSKKQVKCQSVFPIGKSIHHRSTSLLMVTKCPTNLTVPKHVRLGCEKKNSSELKYFNPVYNPADEIPALFRNEFCAKCHGKSLTKHINISAKCLNITKTLKANTKLTLADLNNDRVFQNCVFSVFNQDLTYKTCNIPDSTSHYITNNGIFPFQNMSVCNLYGAAIPFSKYKNIRCGRNYSKLTDDGCEKKEEIPNSKYRYQFQMFFDTQINAMRTVSKMRVKFPIREFLGISEKHDNQGKPSSLSFYLCLDAKDRSENCDHCWCSGDCYEKKKCCIDKDWDETNPQPLSTYISTFLKKLSTIPRPCEPLFPTYYSKILNAKTEYYYMTKDCTYGSEKERKYCLGRGTLSHLEIPLKEFIIPVLGWNKELYANSYCAICNNVTNYVYVKIVLSKPITKGLKDVNEIFRIKQEDKSSGMMMCNNNFYTVRNCFPNSSNFQLCTSYAGKVHQYANHHCWRCMMDNDNLVNLNPRCSSYPSEGGTPPSYSWSKTLSFYPSEGMVYCTDNQIYDKTSGECVAKICLPYYKRVGSKCQKLLTQCEQNDCQAIYMYLMIANSSNKIEKAKLNGKLTVLENISIARNVGLEFERLTTRGIADIIFVSKHPVDKMSNFNLLLEFIKTSSKFQTKFWMNGVEKIIFSHKVFPQSITRLYGFNLSRIFPGGRICSKPVRLASNDATTSNLNQWYYQNNSRNNLSIVVTVYKNKTVNKEFIICHQFHLDKPCVVTLLKHNEISIDSNGSLQHGTDLYEPEKYAPTSEGYHVCATLIKPSEGKLQIAEYYLTIVGAILSIFGYLWIIIEFFIFKELHSVPGFNTMFLCCFLLVSDIVHLAEFGLHHSQIGCHVASVIQHWALLCVFMWTLVITFDLVKTFSGSISSIGNINLKKSVAHRFLIVVLPTTALVLTSLTLDLTGAVDIGYGNKQCWIQNVTAKISLYIAPIVFISFVCTIGLVYTVYQINNQRKAAESVLKKGANSSKESMKIALKLILILGITETIGLLQINPTNPTATEESFNACVRLLSGFLRSFRGVGLWFCYIPGGKSWKVCKREVLRRNINRGIVRKNDSMTKTTSMEML